MKKVLAFGAACLTAVLAAGEGCTTNALVAKGGTCFQSIDCQTGLVCIYVNDAGSCTDDLNNIVSVPESGAADAVAQPDAPLDAPADQNVRDVTSPPDSGNADTGGQDTGAPETGASDAGPG